MACKPGKRHLPRRELEWIRSLLETSYKSCHPPENLPFEIENSHGAASFQQASHDVTKEVLAVWEYAGYGEILHDKTYILKKVKALYIGYNSLVQVPSFLVVTTVRSF